MRVLVLGASGMLGHKLLQVLSSRFEVAGTVRGLLADVAGLPVLDGARLIPEVRAEDLAGVEAAIEEFGPDAVLNCIGVIKQLDAGREATQAIQVNALFPHQLAEMCVSRDIRLVHFGTDCVFSGKRGNYTEEDMPDAEDLYGRTKLLGEIGGTGCLTLRTSIIGRELVRDSSLLEWFLGHREKHVSGFAKALFTGFTTQVLAAIVGDILLDHPDMDGVWHVSADPISKYELLKLVNEAYGTGVTIEENHSFFCDRRLDSTRFRQTTGFQPPNWPDMIRQIAADPTPYGQP